MAGPALTLSLMALSQVGCRERNEDACGWWEGAGSLVAVLCDGAGGHGGGQAAARAAVSHVLGEFAARPEISADALSRLVQGADRAVLDGQRPGTTTADMRTTIVVLLVDLYSGAALWAHAGDSRLYRWRAGRLVGRTRDHSLERSLEDAGLRAAEGGGQLTSALGSPEGFEIDLLESPELLAPGDALLLCSDGVWSALGDAVIAGSLDGCADTETWLEWLDGAVRDADRPNQDNYSALAVWCGAG